MKVKTLTHDSAHIKCGDYEQFVDDEGNEYRISGITLAAIPQQTLAQPWNVRMRGPRTGGKTSGGAVT